MKLITLNIGNDVIEAHNNMWTGVETVYFNGKKVSSQFNWFHGIHKFSVSAPDGHHQDHYRVDFRVNFTQVSMVSIDVFKNGVCLLNQSGTNYRFDSRTVAVANDTNPDGEVLALRELETVPLYREEDLV